MLLASAIAVTGVPLTAWAQGTPADFIATLPCRALISADVQNRPSSQWLSLAPSASNMAPLGIAPIDWTDAAYNALKARVRECGRSAPAALVPMVSTLLSVIDRQQAAQAPITAGLRRRQAEQQAIADSTRAELRTIRQLPDARDQVERLKRLLMDTTAAGPDVQEEVQVALEQAQALQVTQAGAVEQEQAVFKQTQERVAAQQRTAATLAELTAIQKVPDAQEQVSRLSQLRTVATGTSSDTLQQIDGALQAAQARRTIQLASAERAARLRQAELALQASRQSAELEAAADAQRRQAALLAQQQAEAAARDQQAADQQASADDARLAALTRERDEVEARRRERAASQDSTGLAPNSTAPFSTGGAPPAQAMARIHAEADRQVKAQASRVAAISRDEELLDSIVQLQIPRGFASFMTLRQLIAMTLANRADLETLAIHNYRCATRCVGFDFKMRGQAGLGLLLRREGKELLFTGVTGAGEAAEIADLQTAVRFTLVAISLAGLSPGEVYEDLVTLGPG